MRRSMGAELEKLRGGDVDFRQFAAATEKDFDRMSADIAKRWKVPPGVDQEDVRQELLMAIVERKLLTSWDPSRGPTLARYVVWQSYVAGKRFVHRQRGAARRDGKAPSRFPLAFSSLGKGRAGDWNEAEAGLEGVTEPEQEEAVAQRQLADGFRVLLGSDEERVAFDLLRRLGGDAEEATKVIAQHPRIAMECGVGSEEEARVLVDRTLENTRRLVHEVLAA
jgi:hypothetical protein